MLTRGRGRGRILLRRAPICRPAQRWIACTTIGERISSRHVIHQPQLPVCTRLIHNTFTTTLHDENLNNTSLDPYLNINDEGNFTKYADIASSAQLILELAMKNLIQKAIKLSGKKKGSSNFGAGE